jgi:hypothetical protein
MRRVVLVVLATTFLAVPASASAKELERLRVCGATGCVTITDRQALRTFVFDAVPTGREPSGTYYVVDASFAAEDGTHTMRLEYDVAANMIRPADDPDGIGWARLTEPQAPQFLEAIGDLEPFGATEKHATAKRSAPKRDGDPFSWLAVLPAALGVTVVATGGFALVRRRRRQL